MSYERTPSRHLHDYIIIYIFSICIIEVCWRYHLIIILNSERMTLPMILESKSLRLRTSSTNSERLGSFNIISSYSVCLYYTSLREILIGWTFSCEFYGWMGICQVLVSNILITTSQYFCTFYTTSLEKIYEHLSEVLAQHFLSLYIENIFTSEPLYKKNF